MSGEKYIGLDVHQATISVAVMDSEGKIVMESILETKASTILEFFAGLRGSLFVTFEEGTWAAWLYDLLKPLSLRYELRRECWGSRLLDVPVSEKLSPKKFRAKKILQS